MVNIEFHCDNCKRPSIVEYNNTSRYALQNGEVAFESECTHCKCTMYKIVYDEKMYEKIASNVELVNSRKEHVLPVSYEINYIKPEYENLKKCSNIFEEFSFLKNILNEMSAAYEKQMKNIWNAYANANSDKGHRLYDLDTWEKSQGISIADWYKKAEFKVNEQYVHNMADIDELRQYVMDICDYISRTIKAKKIQVDSKLIQMNEIKLFNEAKNVLDKADFNYAAFRSELFGGAGVYGFDRKYVLKAREIVQTLKQLSDEIFNFNIKYNSKGEAKRLSNYKQEELDKMLRRIRREVRETENLCKVYYEDAYSRLQHNLSIVNEKKEKKKKDVFIEAKQKKNKIDLEYQENTEKIDTEKNKINQIYKAEFLDLHGKYVDTYLKSGTYGARWVLDPTSSLFTENDLSNPHIRDNRQWFCLTDLLREQKGTWEHPKSVSNELRLQKLCIRIQEPCELDFYYPDTIPFRRGFSLLLEYNSKSERANIMMGVKSLMLRMLLTNPPGRVSFTLIDPVNVGTSFNEFLPLMEKNASLIDTKPWTDKREITDKLKSVRSYIENVGTKYFVGRYDNIADFNEGNSDMPIDYKVLIISDVQSAIDEMSAPLLKDILINGPSCGVIPIIMLKKGSELPRSLTAKDIEGLVGYQLSDINSDALPPVEVINDILDLTAKRAEVHDSKVFNYEKMLSMCMENIGKLMDISQTAQRPNPEVLKEFLPDWIWASSSIDGIRVPIGLGTNRKIVEFEIGTQSKEYPIHDMLVTGRQGSGKSNFLDVIILTCCLMYSPDELELYLVDLKEGMEFNSYAAAKLPQAKEIALTAKNREYAVYVLKRLVDELVVRAQLCKDSGSGIKEMKDYRLATGKKMPRILAIFDEYQKLFDNNDALSLEANKHIEDLARRGRAVGINLIFSTQTIRANDGIPSFVKDLFAIRASFMTDENNAREIMKDNNKAASELSSIGRAIYNQKAGEISGNQAVQIARLEKPQVINLAGVVRQFADINDFRRVPIVFDDVGIGSQNVQLQTCVPLMQQLGTKSSFDKKNKYIRIWIGQPLKSTEPIKLLFERGFNRNLLFLSRIENHILGTLASMIVSILSSNYERKVKIHIINGFDSDSENIVYIEQLAGIDDNYLNMVNKTESLKPLLGSISSLIEIRNNPDLQGLDDDEEDHFLIFLNIEKFSELNLKRPTSGFGKGGNSETLQDQFKKILEEGSQAGVFLAICAGSWKSLENFIKTDKKSLNNFAMKATGPLEMMDSDKLINSPAAAKLGNSEWMVFYDEDNPGEYPAFRIYQKPDIVWVKNILGGID